MKNFGINFFRKNLLIFSVCFLASLSAGVKFSQAATLYVEPATAAYGYGDVFAANLKIDLDGPDECINTVEGVVGFDKDFLEMVDFSAGESILSLWIELPKTEDIKNINHDKRLKFTGGTPGGYCGKIPGDPGESNILARVMFKVNNFKEPAAALPQARIYFLDTTRVLLNDGQGSAAKLTFKPAVITVGGKSETTKKEWENIKKDDKTPPEPFILEIQESPGVFDGKKYLIFNTVDKQTGIDRYEILESAPPAGRLAYLKSLFGFRQPEPNWQRVAIPYLLKDQSLNSDIKVRAIDKAGNERIAEYVPKKIGGQAGGSIKIIYLVLSLFIAAVVIFSAVGIVRRKNRPNDINKGL